VQAGAAQVGTIQSIGSTKIKVDGGQQSVTFRVLTAGVAAGTVATFTASSGNDQATATLTVNPASLVSVSIAPATMLGGTNATGTVTLDGPAPAGTGATIQLAGTVTSNAFLSDGSVRTVSAQSPFLPTTVTVPPGGSSATFAVTTTPVSPDQTITVSATLGNSARSTTFVVKAPVVTALLLNPSTVVAGNSATGTIVPVSQWTSARERADVSPFSEQYQCDRSNDGHGAGRHRSTDVSNHDPAIDHVRHGGQYGFDQRVGSTVDQWHGVVDLGWNEQHDPSYDFKPVGHSHIASNRFAGVCRSQPLTSDWRQSHFGFVDLHARSHDTIGHEYDNLDDDYRGYSTSQGRPTDNRSASLERRGANRCRDGHRRRHDDGSGGRSKCRHHGNLVFERGDDADREEADSRDRDVLIATDNGDGRSQPDRDTATVDGNNDCAGREPVDGPH
jgi:hypothetical protein